MDDLARQALQLLQVTHTDQKKTGDEGSGSISRAVGAPDENDRDEPKIIVEEATKPVTVFWEGADGVIRGPAPVTHLAKCEEADRRETFWVCIEYQGQPRWVRDDRLRSRAQWAKQPVGLQESSPPACDVTACPCCGQRRWWRSVHGATVCGSCYPPADPALVAEWREAL